MKRLLAVAAVVAALVAALSAAAGVSPPTLRFHVLAKTGIKLTDVAWTGRRLVYVENTENTLYSAPPSGLPATRLASLPRVVEETRCVASPGTHGFPAGALFCHAPDNKVYRVSDDGSEVSLFATIPEGGTADGALAFDPDGSFGYRLVAATGRSGNPQPAGGTVWTIDSSGSVARVGSYDGPGGADEVIVAPAGFGSAAGQALLAVDAGHSGAVVAMDAKGHTRTVVKLPDGPNPIAAIPRSATRSGAVSPGFYVVDTSSTNAYVLPAAELAPYAGKVLVGSELLAHFWVIAPHGRGFDATQLPTTLRGGKYNLEGGHYFG